jgi:hypothetical protein
MLKLKLVYCPMPIVYLAVLSFLSSILGTITGFGISTVMVPIVLLFLPLPETLLLVGVVHWFGDLWKVFLFKHGIHWKILLFFGIPGIITGIGGAYLALKLPAAFLSMFIGAILVAYVIFLLLKPDFKLKATPLAAMLGGGGSGLLGGMTGIGGGALRSIVLTAFGLPKSIYLFTSGLIGFVIDASRITTYFAGGVRLERNLLLGLILFIFLSFIGAKIGKTIVNKIPQERFRGVIGFFLFILGVKLFFFP